jgi:predicted ArsR family transcriptional regulator
VSVPARDYRGLAGVLAEVVEDAGLEPALYAAARRHGQARADDGADPVAVLVALGYAPVRDGDTVRLRNCPFDAVARSHPPVVCGANLELIRGALGDGAEARLDPRPGHCCVAVRCTDGGL